MSHLLEEARDIVRAALASGELQLPAAKPAKAPAAPKEPFADRRRPAAPDRPAAAEVEADLPAPGPAGAFHPDMVSTVLASELRGLIDQADAALTAQRRREAMADVYRLLLHNLTEDLGAAVIPPVLVVEAKSRRRAVPIVKVRHQAICTALVAGIPDAIVLEFFQIDRRTLAFVRQRGGIAGRIA